MSERIYKALPEHFIRLMRNWARGTIGGFLPGDALISSCYRGEQFASGYAEAAVPTLMGEVADVERALNAVPIRYRQAVQIFWWWEGCSLSAIGRRLGGISYHTAEVWVMRGHELLRKQLKEQRAKAAAIAVENMAAISSARY